MLREVFFASSRLDHLRQHERVSQDDAARQVALQAPCVDGAAPVVARHVTFDGRGQYRTGSVDRALQAADQAVDLVQRVVVNQGRADDAVAGREA